MSISTITQPTFVVDTEAERSTSWPDCSLVWCKDTMKMYELSSGSWNQVGGNITPVQSSATRSISSTGFQVSTTKNAMVFYSVQIATTATIGSGAVGYVTLEISPNNSTWTEVSRFTNGQVITLAIALNSVQTIGGSVCGYVPSSYYARLRSVNTTGTPTYTYIAGQEVLL